MPLKHAILGLLNYADMTGYDIDRYFKSSIAFFCSGMRKHLKFIKN